MSEIYLIRHGQASFGSENYDRLSDTGVRQAEILGRHLAALKVKFDAVYSGQMDRQQKTAKGVAEAYAENGLFIPELVVDRSFNEYDSVAVWEAQIEKMRSGNPHILDEIKKDPQNNRAFQKVFEQVVQRWVSGRFDAPGDVVWKDFKDRVASGLKQVMAAAGSSKTIAIFSSGGPISVAVQLAFDLSDVKTIETSWHIVNASVTRLRFGSNKISLTGFNNIAHLEMTGDPTLLTYR